MTPAARLQAAALVLDQVLAGQPAEQALVQWARGARYAGSGDRAAVRDRVFDALRCQRSYTALAGQAAPSGRALMIGALRAEGTAHGALMTGDGHALAPLDDDEMARLASAPDWADLPAPVRLDQPDWLWPLLEQALGDGAADILARHRQRAPVFLRCNLARATRDAAAAALAAEGILASPCPVPSALVVLEKSSKIKTSRAYDEGLVELQDLSSQAAIGLLPLCDGISALDYCAGGGGKALAMAAAARLRLTAHDAAPRRMADLPERARRAGARIAMAETAALTGRQFDLVLVDAPCSGSGTWRRTPDAKWRLTPARLEELVALQAGILDQAAAHVAPGGHLAYMTCSFLKGENDDQIARFLTRHPSFAARDLRHFGRDDAGAFLGDGFFAALLSRARP